MAPHFTCPYFVDVCLKIIAPHLTTIGFVLESPPPESHARFRNGTVAIEYHYCGDCFPWELIVLIGKDESKTLDLAKHQLIPSWFVLEKLSAETHEVVEHFRDETSLESALFVTLKNTILNKLLETAAEDKQWRRIHGAFQKYCSELE